MTAERAAHGGYSGLASPTPRSIPMKQRILDVVSTFALLTVLGLAAAMLMPRAYAGMIPTEQTQSGDRAAVKDMLARPEVVREMQKTGIPPEKAAARVDAMSD